MLVGGLITALTALAWHVLRGTDVDDSWIHLRVARNWAEGLGPVFNAGEHVEVSTSPAWLTMLAAGIRVGMDGPAWALGLGVASTLAVGAGTARLAASLARKRPVATGVLAAFLTAANVSFSYWASTRMEVAFSSALLVWSINCALSTKDAIGALSTGVLCALTGLARPELLSVVPLVLTLALMQVPRTRRTKLALVAIGATVLPLGLHLIARYRYYGLLVPNTYIAKVAGKSLGARVQSSLVVLADFARYQPLLLIPIGWAAVRSRGLPRLFAYGCLVLLLAVAWSGGDHFVFCRLAVPLVPIASVLTALLLSEVSPRAQLGSAALFLVQGLAGYRHYGWRTVDSALYVQREESVARAIKLLPEGAVATLGIGVLGYRCPERRIIDLVGLADAHIARSPHIPGAANGHDHSDANYVVDRAPAIVFPHILSTDRALTDDEELVNLRADRAWYQSGLDLLTNPRFVAGYAPRNLALDNGRFVRVWMRRNLRGMELARSSAP